MNCKSPFLSWFDINIKCHDVSLLQKLTLSSADVTVTLIFVAMTTVSSSNVVLQADCRDSGQRSQRSEECVKLHASSAGSLI